MRIVIADDHTLFRNGLRSLLESHGHEVVGEASDGAEAVSIVERLKPDVVLMDLGMPELDGLQATRSVIEKDPDQKIVILTASADEANLFDAIKAGAQGYLLKDLEADAFFSLLDAASRGEPAMTPKLASKVLAEFAKGRDSARSERDPDELTEREQDVLELMVRGFTSNRKLARQLDLSENTVKFHVRNILDKLRLHTRAEAVGYALRKGLVDVPDEK